MSTAESDLIDCRYCGLSITLHEGIGGAQWRDNSSHSPGVCFKARNLVHSPEDPTCTGCGGLLRVERALMTCDTADCPGNLQTRLSWRGPIIPPAPSTPEEA